MARLAIFCALVFIADGAFGQTPTPGERTAAIQAVREYALSYTKGLPNYICTLTTRETSRPPGSGPTIGTTVIEEQLRFADSRETRRITRIDGRPVSPQEAGERPKEMSWGEFGN